VRQRGIQAAVAVITLSTTIILPIGPARADSVRNDEWHLVFLKVKQAQAITKGDGVVVGVVDSGVSPHRDLRGNLLKGTDLVSGGHGDGQVDQLGHGTEMAGLIAAHGKSATDGVLGIAPGAKILPIKEANPSNNGDSSTTGNGIKWAVEHGAKVVNVSSATTPSFGLQEGIAAAKGSDAVVVASAGNRPQVVTYGFPAAMPGVLAVGAVDRSGKHAALSVTGPATQICAPGVGIIAAEPTNKYVNIDGTSPATAIVSGAAALVRAKFPQLSAQEVIHRLTATATDIGKPGRDDECGYGVLNIVKALTADVPPLDGTTTATPSAGPSAGPTSTPATDSASAPGNNKPAGNNTPAIVGGVVIVLLVAGLLAFLGIRRRRTP
jgi:type VII secretion-associated serine protease mycosin